MNNYEFNVSIAGVQYKVLLRKDSVDEKLIGREFYIDGIENVIVIEDYITGCETVMTDNNVHLSPIGATLLGYKEAIITALIYETLGEDIEKATPHWYAKHLNELSVVTREGVRHFYDYDKKLLDEWMESDGKTYH